MSTLKKEEIYCNQYRDLEDLNGHIKEFIDTYYNRLRLHSALGYLSPEQFELANQVAPTHNLDAATMKYFQPPKRAPGVSGKEKTTV